MVCDRWQRNARKHQTAVGKKRGEAVVSAVEHETQNIQSQNYYAGNKESEKESARNLLKDSDLIGEKVTLEAL